MYAAILFYVQQDELLLLFHFGNLVLNELTSKEILY